MDFLGFCMFKTFFKNKICIRNVVRVLHVYTNWSKIATKFYTKICDYFTTDFSLNF